MAKYIYNKREISLLTPLFSLLIRSLHRPLHSARPHERPDQVRPHERLCRGHRRPGLLRGHRRKELGQFPRVEKAKKTQQIVNHHQQQNCLFQWQLTLTG